MIEKLEGRKIVESLEELARLHRKQFKKYEDVPAQKQSERSKLEKASAIKPYVFSSKILSSRRFTPRKGD